MKNRITPENINVFLPQEFWDIVVLDKNNP
jgi:hypothetical protein